jgi:crotonobetainyl-CoA:carnitine CoA-transferase CaiB-like acyl-CoA transferase
MLSTGSATARALRALNPELITASLNAYGWAGPWRRRRGFDSLVQMSSGIAAAGARETGQDAPRPLPAQALDHGTGYLAAAAVTRALTRYLVDGQSTDLRCSLVATANVLMDYPVPGGLAAAGPERTGPEWTQADTEPTATHWGPARRVPIPGRIDGIAAALSVPAGPLGRDSARWARPR